MCDGFGIAPDTFLNCLCVQSRFIEIYGSSGSVGTFVEGAALQEIYSILATIRGWIGTWYISLTHHFQKDYSCWGPWCAFHFTKVTVASPHTTQEYQPCHGFCMGICWTPSRQLRPRRSGPNHSLPSPRRAYLWSAATLPAAASISHRLPIRSLSQIQRHSQPISIHDHRTIL